MWLVLTRFCVGVAAMSLNTPLEHTRALGGNLTLHWTHHPNKTLDLELHSALAGWLSMGFNTDAVMVGSDVLLGWHGSQHGEHLTSNVHLKQYKLRDKLLSAITPIRSFVTSHTPSPSPSHGADASREQGLSVSAETAHLHDVLELDGVPQISAQHTGSVLSFRRTFHADEATMVFARGPLPPHSTSFPGKHTVSLAYRIQFAPLDRPNSENQNPKKNAKKPVEKKRSTRKQRRGVKSPKAIKQRKRRKAHGPPNPTQPDFEDESVLLLTMPRSVPLEPDTYQCRSTRAPAGLSHTVAFHPVERQAHMHHLILFGCVDPVQHPPATAIPDGGIAPPQTLSDTWNCGMGQPVCRDQATVMYAWALQAGPMRFPKGVGHVVGGKSRIQYFVLQIHYKNAFPAGLPAPVGLSLSLRPGLPDRFAGMLVLVGSGFSVPPHTPKHQVAVECAYERAEILHVFAYRTHAHDLGTLITGHKRVEGNLSKFATRSPQRPQGFVVLPDVLSLEKGHRIQATCTYDSMGVDTPTRAGSGAADEMCNLYLMFYTDAPSQHSFTCLGHGGNQKSAGDVKYLWGGSHPLSAPMEAQLSHSALFETSWRSRSPLLESVLVPYADLLDALQVTGIDVVSKRHGIDSDGDVSAATHSALLFHRGGRMWGVNTFGSDGQLKDRSPIDVDTVAQLDQTSGKLTDQWGKGQFYLPHGLTADQEGNLWLTDVGSHQVYKVSGSRPHHVLLELGRKMQPGADLEHFCKPTDVVVTNDGTVFIADGYCNSRLVQFTAQGSFIREINLLASLSPVVSSPSSFSTNSQQQQQQQLLLLPQLQQQPWSQVQTDPFPFGVQQQHQQLGNHFGRRQFVESDKERSSGNYDTRTRFPILPHSLAYNPIQNIIYVADRENGRVLSVQLDDADFGTRTQTHPRVRVSLLLPSETRCFAVAYTPSAGGLLSVLVQKGQDSRVLVYQAASSASWSLVAQSALLEGLFLHDLSVAVQQEQGSAPPSLTLSLHVAGWTNPQVLDIAVEPRILQFSQRFTLLYQGDN